MRKMNRNLDNIPVQCYRDGKEVTICLSDCAVEEMHRVLETLQPEDMYLAMSELANSLKTIATELQFKCERQKLINSVVVVAHALKQVGNQLDLVFIPGLNLSDEGEES